MINNYNLGDWLDLLLDKKNQVDSFLINNDTHKFTWGSILTHGLGKKNLVKCLYLI